MVTHWHQTHLLELQAQSNRSRIPARETRSEERMAGQNGTSVRHILLHYHVFRNGGHIIDCLLEKNFFDALIHLNSRDPESTITNSDLLRTLRDQPQVQAVSSYHLRPLKPEVEDFVFFDIFFLRHPLDRVLAMYDGFRDPNSAGPLAETAKQDLNHFAEQLVAGYPHLVNDAQVNFLANSGRYFRPPTDSDLHRAVQTVEQAALPGLTQDFDRSLTVAEYYFRPAFPTIDLSYVRPTPLSSPAAWQSRLDLVKSSCAPAIYDRLVEMNQLDLKLVNFAQEELCRRFRLIPNAEQRMADLSARSSKAAEYFLEYDDVNAQ